MNRRAYLVTAGAAAASLAGATGLARTYRADVAADSSLVRGRGDPVATSGTVERDSLEYLPETDEVRYATMYRTDGTAVYGTESFERWARRECVSVGSEAVLPAIENRLGEPPKGVGKGVRGLLFGLAITVDHVVTRGRDGSVQSEPNVGFEELVSVAPRSVTATVALDGHEYTRPVAVAVGHAKRQPLRGDWSAQRPA